MKRLIAVVMSFFILAACVQDGQTLTFRTADPSLNISFRLLPPPVVPATPTVDLVPTVTPTSCRTIAGNINSQGQKLWHDESSPQWSQIVIDESKGERWFCTPEEAEAAGWTKAGGQ